MKKLVQYFFSCFYINYSPIQGRDESNTRKVVNGVTGTNLNLILFNTLTRSWKPQQIRPLLS